jgi:hypothetical protein
MSEASLVGNNSSDWDASQPLLGRSCSNAAMDGCYTSAPATQLLELMLWSLSASWHSCDL